MKLRKSKKASGPATTSTATTPALKPVEVCFKCGGPHLISVCEAPKQTEAGKAAKTAFYAAKKKGKEH